MIEHITTGLKETFIQTANTLKGHERRRFMAGIIKGMGRGGAVWAERALGWDRKTARKGGREAKREGAIEDKLSARGRKKVEEQLPNFLEDIKEVVDGESQTDGTFRTTKMYVRQYLRQFKGLWKHEHHRES